MKVAANPQMAQAGQGEALLHQGVWDRISGPGDSDFTTLERWSVPWGLDVSLLTVRELGLARTT